VRSLKIYPACGVDFREAYPLKIKAFCLWQKGSNFGYFLALIFDIFLKKAKKISKIIYLL
jgi:hypothetical protein